LKVCADTSFLVSLYATEVHSPEAQRRIALRPSIYVTPLNQTEVMHAFFNQVFRSKIAISEARLAWSQFSADCARGLWTLVDLPVNSWQTCVDLGQRHGATLGNRTLDSLHVACALELKAQKFWTFDERQARLAEAAGLDTTA